ncbi:bifunctional 4-hydroxy-2-oxoglutarate aldolase/2-dehydro-3-deoxy-phosphogluconate aldolase [Salinisphaera sp. Q1T1-3]|uniref:bifunctional 4-hydroxy-2-oxoglutarate aldolase/2-dehydro-3-deoxy-phosphogluconate aldolase n=1 Tax=Salinisphaera sp. Q1T1-3 TaxID=2321229 RepID=UPI000E743C83|nr:bifunctional 4-hydroxy-2-oxoglutarate aldolase/2-dehydro-3-deoxy-phosphogluconate aldolase [Salinisphaera sp. Q1T1-3]RJS93102.1 bifunctional 4-hydroxy-2-oxoglutarate aldolase/2-dehydro-3-deoxy-phosphogluconate aldolase [Salinisphaera sp. Q1T1-3]
MADTFAIMKLSPVIPVVTFHDVDEAVAVARDIHAGGLKTIEITRRTSVAVEAMQAIARDVPELVLGMGTVWSADQCREAIDAGAKYIVSPGVADEVGDVCREADIPYLPGAQTVSEVAHLVRQGWQHIKLFPASVIGGPAAIKAYAAVFPDVKFCPTGGITEQTAPDYLKLPSIPCVGGSWLAKPPGSDEAGAQSAVAAAATRAAALGSS